MADRYESSLDDSDRKGNPDEHKQSHKQYDSSKFPKKEFNSAEGKQQPKTIGKEKKKFLGNCYICGKAGHRTQDCYKKVSTVDGKGKAIMAQGSLKSENQ